MTDRFEQIAHGVGIERSHGIFITSGYEYDERQNWYYWEEPATSRNKLGIQKNSRPSVGLIVMHVRLTKTWSLKANFGKLIEYEKLI